MTVHPQRSDLHLPRRLFHLFNGLAIVFVAFFLETRQEAFLTLLFLTLFAFAVDWIRIQSPRFGRWVSQSFESVLRKGEEKRFSGVPYYLLGCTIAMVIFPKPIALLSILYLAVGDPIASLVGNRLGRVQLPKNMDLDTKSWEGSLACLFVCALLTFFSAPTLFESLSLGVRDRLLLGLIGGLGAALAEILPLRTDDNLTLPVVSGAFLWIAASLLELIPGLYF